MNDEFKLSMELTAIDMLSAVAKKAKDHIKGLGEAGKEVQRDFDSMTQHITRGSKAAAVASYVVGKLKPGVAAAADMQEELHKVEMNLANSTDNAALLHKQLQAIRDTANFIGQNSPFTAQQIVGIEAQLLKSGIGFQEVTGQHGVTWSASGLAALSGMDPSMVGENLAKIGQTFGYNKGKEYSEIANWLEKAESSAGHDLGKLFYGLQMSGNSAHALGISGKDTITALTMMAPLGEMAGTSLNRFIDRFTGGRREERKYLQAMGLDFFDKSGKFKGFSHAMDEVRTKFSGIASDQKKLILFEKIFGEEGKRAAEIVAQSKRSFQEWQAFIDSHKDINEKTEIWAQGFNASWTKLMTTIKSTGATLFDPMLKPLTVTNDLVNNITGKLGSFAEGHKGFAKIVSYGATGVAGGASLYALYNLVMGATYGGNVLRGLRGLSGTAIGVGEGKLVEGMTGVAPVFVTNFPPPLPAVPVIGGMVPTQVMFAPALLTAIVGALSIVFGEHKTEEEVKYSSDKRLRELRTRHMVLGGGPDTFQVRTIDAEMERRHGASLKNLIQLTVHVDAQGQVYSRSNDLNTILNTMPRGTFFPGGMMKSHE